MVCIYYAVIDIRFLLLIREYQPRLVYHADATYAD